MEEGMRLVTLDEKIELGDMYYGEPQRLIPVQQWMIGKTIYEASKLHFPNTDKILSVFRAEEEIRICSEDRVKIHVEYTNVY